MNIQKYKSSVALLSIISNSTLTLLKVAVGIMIGSVSIISEAIHSGVDLLAALIAWFAVKTSDKPADADHPFGHGKYENISGTVEALLIFFAALLIIFEASEKIIHYTKPIDSAGWGVGIMLASSLTNYFVSKRLYRVGRITDSIALQADGVHLRTDVYTSLGVMTGMAVICVGKYLLPNINLQWVDPAAAIAVAGLIIKAAYNLTRESARDLLDVSLPANEEEWISEYIASLGDTIRGFHHLRTRKSGSQRFIQFHLLVRSDMSVDESHNLNDKIVAAIKEHYPECNVTIHIEPCKGNCTDSCISGCFLDEATRGLIKRKFNQTK